MRVRDRAWVFCLLTLLSHAPMAATPPGVRFQHNDWELVCDNTRTCRAAGYQAGDGDMAVSVLLTRKAGPKEPVRAQLQLGNFDNEELFKTLPPTMALAMDIDHRAYGKVMVGQEDMTASLAPAQTQALLAALMKDSTISWSFGDHTWTLSGKGAAAVLLKMDEFQGRIGTTGALARKGAKDETQVLPPLAPLVVEAAPVPPAAKAAVSLPKAQLAVLRKALASTVENDDCEDLTRAGDEQSAIDVSRLSDTHWLASARCWLAAYNVGNGYWVINTAPPFAPRLVTLSGSDYAEGTISSASKGRGLGDCWSSETWTWDGRQFVHTGDTTTGMCKLVAPGGPWDMPLLVTTVHRRTTGK